MGAGIVIGVLAVNTISLATLPPPGAFVLQANNGRFVALAGSSYVANKDQSDPVNRFTLIGNDTAIQVVDLGPTGALGLTSIGGSLVRLDDDGAGRGWFVDPTPADDAEFYRDRYEDALGYLERLPGRVAVSA